MASALAMMWIPQETGATFTERPASVTREAAMPCTTDTRMISVQVKLKLKPFCQTSHSYHRLMLYILHLNPTCHSSSVFHRLKWSVLSSSNPPKRKWFSFQNPAVKIQTFAENREGWNCPISVLFTILHKHRPRGLSWAEEQQMRFRNISTSGFNAEE